MRAGPYPPGRSRSFLDHRRRCLRPANGFIPRPGCGVEDGCGRVDEAGERESTAEPGHGEGRGEADWELTRRFWSGWRKR
jgi:hypothetical protein